MDTLTLKPYISDLQQEWFRGEARVTRQHINRASEAGHPCSRYLVYCRTSHKLRKVPEPYLQGLFTLGWDLEEIVIRWLKERLKLEVIQPKDRDFFDEVTETSGHMDGFLEEKQHDGSKMWVPIEIKGVAAGTWDTVKSHEDMKSSSRPWVKKWAVQLPLYMWMDSKPYGRYVFFQKESGQLRDFPVVLDDCTDILDETFKKLKSVNQHIKDGTLPKRFYEPDDAPSVMCDGCDFEAPCMPGGSFVSALQALEDHPLANLISQWEALGDRLKEYRRLDTERKKIASKIKKAVTDKERILVDNRYLVTGKLVEKKAQDATTYWKWNAKRVE